MRDASATAAATVLACDPPLKGATPRRGLRVRLRARWTQRWPVIRRQLPRDAVILLWLALLCQSMGVAWVMTDSVHASAALILKGAPVRPGELAVFAYAGGSLEGYYPDTWLTQLQRGWGLEVSLAGPRRGDGFVKYLIGVAGDRIEVVGDQVVLQTARGRLAMGRCKPTTRKGVPLAPIRPQTIPEGFVYVWAPHVDALDSRYSVMGLVPVTSIVGRAVRLW